MKRMSSIITVVCIFALVLSGVVYANTIQEHENVDEPFGFHPALIKNKRYDDSGYKDAKNIGVCWNRPSIYAFWFLIQPDLTKDEYNFRLHDRIFNEVPDDINILGNISADISGRGRKDATHDHYMKERSYEPVDIPMYEKFVQATVERYDGDGIDDMPGLTNPVKYWQVDNEPPRDGKKDFAVLQEITYKAIKSACPECKVLIGGATGFPDSFDSNFKAYTKILEDLNGMYVDIFDLHWYGNAFGEYRDLGDSLAIVKRVLEENGFGDIPIWITEMGSYSGRPIGRTESQFPYQSEQMQALDYFKRHIYSLSIGVEKVFPAFGLIEGFKHDGGYFDHTGLIYNDRESDDLGLGVKKLSYWTYKLMTDKLIGSDWDTLEEINAEDNIYTYRIIKDEEPMWIVWWDWFDEDDYTEGMTTSLDLQLIDLSSSAVLSITDVVPLAENGLDIDETDYPEFFDSKTINSVNGQLHLQLGKNPVIIEVVEYLESESTKEISLSFQIGEPVYHLEGEKNAIDIAPVIKDGRTLLPARYVVEPLGGQVFWDGDERKVTCKLVAPDNTETAEYKENIVELWIDEPVAKINGEEVQIDPHNPDVTPIIINDRTFVPVRFLAENLGCETQWDAETREITLTYAP